MRLAGCLVLLATLIPATSASASPTGSAATAWKECPYLPKYDTTVGAKHVSCRMARRVARAYMAASDPLAPPRGHQVLGFRCRVVWVGHPRSDWYAICRKGDAGVVATPE
jgi:hypothetical protein